MSATTEAPKPQAAAQAAPVKAAVTKPMHRFRLLAGIHIDGFGPAGEDGKATERVFRRGDIIDTPEDLAGKFGMDKFERLYGDGSTREIPSKLDLTKLSVRQLMALAEDEGVDLKGASRKEDVINILQKAGM